MTWSAPFSSLVSAVVLVLVVASAALANEAPMRITDVRFTDLDDASQIEVVGTQFDNGATPVVTLNGAPILVHGASATHIQAELPHNTPDGDYTVGVSTGPGTKQNAEQGLTVAPLVAMSAPASTGSPRRVTASTSTTSSTSKTRTETPSSAPS